MTYVTFSFDILKTEHIIKLDYIQGDVICCLELHILKSIKTYSLSQDLA
jgi:hypothetical protein